MHSQTLSFLLKNFDLNDIVFQKNNNGLRLIDHYNKGVESSSKTIRKQNVNCREVLTKHLIESDIKDPEDTSADAAAKLLEELEEEETKV